MKIKEMIAAGMICSAAVLAVSSFMPAQAAAAKASAKAAPVQASAAKAAPATAPVTAAAAASNTAKDLQAEAKLSQKHYMYTSKTYGFSVLCPKKPIGVIPASVLYPGKEGDILVFDNDGYDLKQAWIIWKDAFTDKDIPDLINIKAKDLEKLEASLKKANGYSQIEVVPMTVKTKALMAITAKELDVDTNGDGKPDNKIVADNQMADIWLRGNKGGHYFARLIDNPELTQEHLVEFKAGLSAFWEN